MDTELHTQLKMLLNQTLLLEQIDTPDAQASVPILVMACLGIAGSLDIPTGLAVDADGTLVAVIDLPTGQVSWPIPQSTRPVDAMNREMRVQRISAFLVRP